MEFPVNLFLWELNKMEKKQKRAYSRHGFPMNLGLQKYVLGRMAIVRDIDQYLPDGWENELDSQLTLPEQFQNLMADKLEQKWSSIRNINSDNLNRVELEIISLINKMYCTLVIEE